jgi:hypothetical protein
VGQFFKVSATVGLPEKLAVPYGEFGAVAPDGKTARVHADHDRFRDVEALPWRDGVGHLAL